MGEQRFSRLAHIAASPQAMLEAVNQTPGAIGFLPRSWISQGVAAIQLGPDLQKSTRKPLLALTKKEPEAGLQALLACLQSGDGQSIFVEHYYPPN